MEKFLNPCDKEYMKMAMLKHEEMFRKQVYELHRLYEIQKMLMKNISISNRGNRHENQDKWTKSKKENSFHNYRNDNMHQQPAGQKLDLEQPAEENTLEEVEIELTLGPSSYCRRRKIDETPLTSDSGLSFSSSSNGSSRIKRKNSGIHAIQDRRKEEVTAHNWGLVEVPNSNPSLLNGRRSNSDIKEQVRQDRVHEQPPWLFQVLSMNIT